ncbi:MAG: DUF6542 domain-containing protein [Nocardioidaceae bacterium]
MTTTSHPTSDPWDQHGSEPEFELLAHESPTPSYDPPRLDDPFDQDRQDDQPAPVYNGADVAFPVTEYTSMPGMPGRGVSLLTTLSAGGCAALDFALTGSLTIFFDLCFVVVCLVAAMAVRRHDIFTTGVLPPLVFAAVIAAVAIRAPSTFVATGALSKVFLTGLTEHAGALVAGYGVALLTVGGRVSAHRRG